MESEHGGARWLLATKVLEADPASAAAGVTLLEACDESVTLSMPVTEASVNGVGVTHGGLTFLLADSAVGVAANSLGAPSAVTSSATITYLAPGRAGDVLRAVCTGPVTNGGRVSVYSVQVHRGDGTVIATMQATMMSQRRAEG